MNDQTVPDFTEEELNAPPTEELHNYMGEMLTADQLVRRLHKDLLEACSGVIRRDGQQWYKFDIDLLNRAGIRVPEHIDRLTYLFNLYNMEAEDLVLNGNTDPFSVMMKRIIRQHEEAEERRRRPKFSVPIYIQPDRYDITNS